MALDYTMLIALAVIGIGYYYAKQNEIPTTYHEPLGDDSKVETLYDGRIKEYITTSDGGRIEVLYETDGRYTKTSYPPGKPNEPIIKYYDQFGKLYSIQSNEYFLQQAGLAN